MANDQTVTAGEMLLVINDIHMYAIAARLVGDDGSIMLDIERLAADLIERACNEGAGDTEFTMEAEDGLTDG